VRSTTVLDDVRVKEIIRAWDEFRDLYSHTYDRGTMHWEIGWDNEPIVEGETECSPFQSVGWVSVGSGEEGGISMSIGVEHFGRITKLLVPEGAQVEPGQPLLEYEARPPTIEEWTAERERATRAEERIHALNRTLDNPLRASWVGIRRALPSAAGSLTAGLIAGLIYLAGIVLVVGLLIGAGALVRAIT
jgi:hypothetical protein